MTLCADPFSKKFQDGVEVDEESRTLWVGGINAEVKEEILFELFINCGPVENVRIPKDKQTMKQKSFGFVVFEHKESLSYAIKQMTGIKLFGQQIIPKISNKNRYSRNSTVGGFGEALYEVNDNVIKKPQAFNKQNNNASCAHPSQELLQFNNIKVNFLESGRTLSGLRVRGVSLTSDQMEESQELHEDERCQKTPQQSIRCDKIKLNLLGSGKNHGTQDCLTSSHQENPKPVKYELKIKTGYKNTEETHDLETPGKWMENKKSPQKCSPEKLSPIGQSERSRERERRGKRIAKEERGGKRIAKEERGRSKERRNRIHINPNHINIIQNGIGDVLDYYVQEGKSMDRQKDLERDEKHSRHRSRSRRRRSGRREREDKTRRSTSGGRQRETSKRDQRKSLYSERRKRENIKNEKSYARKRPTTRYDFSEPVSMNKKIAAKTLSPYAKETAEVNVKNSGKVKVIECIDLEEGEILDEEGEIVD